MRAIAWLMSVAVLGLAGCTSFSPRETTRGALSPPAPMHARDWPRRDVEMWRPAAAVAYRDAEGAQGGGDLEEALGGSESTVRTGTRQAWPVLWSSDVGGEARGAGGGRGVQTRMGYRVASGGAAVHGEQTIGQGVLRVLGASADPYPTRARFISSWQIAEGERLARAMRTAAPMREFSGTLSVAEPLDEASAGGWEGTEGGGIVAPGIGIVLPPGPASPSSPRARGLVVHLSGPYTGEYEKPLLDTFESRGWAVIRVGTIPPASPRAGGGRRVSVQNYGDVGKAAAEIAAIVDEALAENAYAVEAALDYCAQHRKDLPTRPVILVGCSSGAVALPAVAARLGDRVDAAILVGGGANVLDILQRSTRPDGQIVLDWGQESIPVERYTELLVQYLASTRLDPYHTARYLVDKPVLVVHAVFDGIVPSSAGRLLYERLGNPDRLRFSGGHSAMFYFMENNAPKIATWLDRVLQARAQAERERASQPPPFIPAAYKPVPQR